MGVSAFMLFVALRYGSYVQHQQAEQKKNGSPKSDPPKEGDGQSPSEGSGSDGGGNGNGSGGGIGGTIGVVEREGMVGSELLAGEGVSLG